MAGWLRAVGRCQRLAHGAVLASLAFTTALPVCATEAWPSAVNARYKLRFNGIDVGHLAFQSKTGAKTYALTSHGEVSVMFGLVKWTGTSSVSGAIDASGPAPKAYAFDWQKNKKGGVIRLGFTGHRAVDVVVDPPSGAHPDTVPITEQHTSGILDPLSAIMALTRADTGDPCNRRVAVFDGKQRFDIVFSYKRKTHIPAPRSGGASSVGTVCRALYEPIAGHRANAQATAYAANRDAEVVLRKIAGSDLLIPHSVTIPTAWGTGTMVIDRVDVTSSATGPFAVTD